MIRVLKTFDAVWQELGSAKIRRLTGASSSAMSNWRTDQRYPARTYLVLTSALKRRDCAAPASLWGMIEAGVTEDAER